MQAAIKSFSVPQIIDRLKAVFKIGEESGKLEDATERLAKISAKKAEWMITQIARWLPVLIYVIIAMWIIKMVFTMYGQIYS